MQRSFVFGNIERLTRKQSGSLFFQATHARPLSQRTQRFGSQALLAEIHMNGLERKLKLRGSVLATFMAQQVAQRFMLY
jgi:hypothetical protein